MLTSKTLADAEALVKGWLDFWQREGRIDGGLDKFARNDLIERIALALTESQPAPKARKKADG